MARRSSSAHASGISPSKSRGERTRIRLLVAAEEIFGSNGYHAASISDITKRAHVAQGTFYIYFTSKLGIFTELFDQMGEDLRRQLHQATAAAPNRMAVEKGGLEAFLVYVTAHPQLYRIAREAEFVTPEKWYQWYDKLIGPYESGLQRAAAAREIRSLDARLITLALIGVADFVGRQLILRHSLRSVPDNVVETLVDFIGLGLLLRTDSQAVQRAGEGDSSA
jgi:AcrR family transcriptional regulator